MIRGSIPLLNNVFVVNLFLLVIPALIAIASLTLIERKILGYMKFHKGPNIVGPYGTLQPIADAIERFTKEPLATYHIHRNPVCNRRYSLSHFFLAKISFRTYHHQSIFSGTQYIFNKGFSPS